MRMNFANMGACTRFKVGLEVERIVGGKMRNQEKLRARVGSPGGSGP